MSMIICPECGKEVSSLAEVCVHCGCPIGGNKSEKAQNNSNRKNKRGIILIVAVVVLLAVVLVSWLLSDRHEHEFVETNVISAICVEDGKREFTCSICDEKYDVPIPKTGEHKYTEIEKVKPTCEKDGHKTFKCTMCCDTYNETLSKTGHAWSDPTCTASKKCSNCGKKEGGTIAHRFDVYGICSMCKLLDESRIDVSKFTRLPSASNLMGEIREDVVIKRGTTVSHMGLLAKNVVVESGAKLILMGMIGENLIVCEGGKVEILGTVGCAVRGSGRIEHYGMIGWGIDDTITGYIHKGAYVNGYRYTENTPIN